MRHSIINRSPSNPKAMILRRAAAIAFWLLCWQGLSLWVNSPILLVSPVQTVQSLLRQLGRGSFWQAVGSTGLRILLGFALSTVLGVLLGVLSYRLPLLETLLSPLISVMKSVPMASITILILLWVPSRNLSICISVLIGLPILYSATLSGLQATDEKLLEMAACFHVPFYRQWLRLFMPQLKPFLQSALSSAIGLCWKSGIAAEVIGIPSGTIGEKLYQAKVTLETPELFSWTLTVVLLSVGCEWVVKRVLRTGT